jgi:hypothetical protein
MVLPAKPLHRHLMALLGAAGPLRGSPDRIPCAPGEVSLRPVWTVDTAPVWQPVRAASVA